MVKLCIMTTVPGTIQAFVGPVQIEYLQQNGFDVTVLTSSKDPCGLPLSVPKGVAYEVVPMTRTITPWQDIKALIKVYLILKKGRFDIIQYATPKASLLGSIAGWMAGIPVRLYLMWGLYYITQNGFKRTIFKTIEKIVCRLSTVIAPDSKGNCKLAVQEGLCKADKISVVGHGSANGVDTIRFDPDHLTQTGKNIRANLNIPEKATVLGCVAPIVRDKGINELIEAFTRIAQLYPDVYLLYVGQVSEKDPVKDSTLRTMDNHKKIIHLGWQTEPEKYMAAMDIFVLPTYREGFGAVNVEASAMRLPVISTDVPGPQESIVNGETGLLVPAKTVAPLVEAIQRLLDNPGFAKQLGTAGRHRIQELYEQKKLWKTIVEHRRKLLIQSGCFKDVDEELRRVR